MAGKTDPESSEARANFVRLAEARTSKLLRNLDLLGNLSNRSNYAYSEVDVQKIFKAIHKRLRDTEARFRVTSSKDASGFKL